MPAVHAAHGEFQFGVTSLAELDPGLTIGQVAEVIQKGGMSDLMQTLETLITFEVFWRIFPKRKGKQYYKG